MTKVKEKTINSVQDYVNFIDSEKRSNENKDIKVDFLFRGQQRDLPLLPKLGRVKLKGEIKNIENVMLKEFERTSYAFTEYQPKTKWDLIALAQHHGLPTRLLDWTYSALTALWFAVEDPPYIEHGETEDGVVWILIPEQDDYDLDTSLAEPLGNSLTKIFRPNVVSKRISSQAGVFTIHKIVKGGKFIKLENHIRFKTKLMKVIVPSGLFASLRKQLNILGINHSTAFPDLDGLCKHLSWRFSFHKDEIKKSALTRASTATASSMRSN